MVAVLVRNISPSSTWQLENEIRETPRQRHGAAQIARKYRSANAVKRAARTRSGPTDGLPVLTSRALPERDRCLETSALTRVAPRPLRQGSPRRHRARGAS